MKFLSFNITYLWAVLLGMAVLVGCGKQGQDEWIELFNGKDLTGWTASENKGSFTVENGMIKANGKRSHLFYTGDVGGGIFKNFELRAEVMALKGSNSGVYFHTQYQEEGWPDHGVEVQVNNSHIGEGDYHELKKSGSLYGTRNVYKAFAQDSVWFTLHIVVKGNYVKTEVNGVTTSEFVYPSDTSRLFRSPSLKGGTFALQGHDPHSTVYYRSVKVKILPDESGSPVGIALDESQVEMIKLQKKDFSFIDLNVAAGANLDTSEVSEFVHRTGINVGLLANYGDKDLDNTIAGFEKLPVFIGLRIDENQDYVELPPALVNRVDYIIGKVDLLEDAPFANPNDMEAYDAFMNDYVFNIVNFLSRQPLHVWSDATKLPKAMAAHYEKLWTEERMDAVINAAIQNGVAIEIDNERKLPSLSFIKRAKEKGCLFTYSGIYRHQPNGKLDYIISVIKQDSLNYKDNYIPRAPWPQKLVLK